MRLLVAEDDPRLLKTLLHIFHGNKWITDGVSNGEDALICALSEENAGYEITDLTAVDLTCYQASTDTVTYTVPDEALLLLAADGNENAATESLTGTDDAEAADGEDAADNETTADSEETATGEVEEESTDSENAEGIEIQVGDILVISSGADATTIVVYRDDSSI